MSFRPRYKGCRAQYRIPFNNSLDVPDGRVECWEVDTYGPVLGPDDFESLGWTTADAVVLDDGRLQLVDPEDGMKQVVLPVVIFVDHTGKVHCGWPVAGYVDSTSGKTWKLIRIMPGSLTRRDSVLVHSVLTINLSSQEVDKLLEQRDDSPPFIKDGEVRKTRAVPVDVLVNAARQKVQSTVYATLTQQSAKMVADPYGGFDIAFMISLRA